MAHQLKGAGGGYGFPQVTDAARTVDMAIRERRIDDAQVAAQALVTLCARVVR
jgi:Fe-S oxidoreductase